MPMDTCTFIRIDYHLYCRWLSARALGIAAQLLQASGVHLVQVGETVHISKAPEADEESITLPTEFQQALQQHPAAYTIFEKLSYSKKKRFVDRIEQAQ